MLNEANMQKAVIVMTDMVKEPFQVIFQGFDEDGSASEVTITTDEFNDVPLLLRENKRDRKK